MYLTIGTRRPTTFRPGSMRPFIYRDPSEGCVSKITASMETSSSRRSKRPGLPKLGLIAEPPRGPLGCSPDRYNYDRDDDRNLSPKHFCYRHDFHPEKLHTSGN